MPPAFSWVVPAEVPTSSGLSVVKSAKAMMFLRTSVGDYLTAIGNNYGVPRPPMDPANDGMYSAIVQALAFQKQTILRTLYALMSAVLGSQGAIVASGGRPWRVYEVTPNEFVIEVPYALIGSSNDNASYLHGWAGLATTGVGASVSVFTTPGDVRVSAVSLVGLNVWVYYSGAYHSSPIVSATYDPITNISTVTQTAVAIPGSLTGIPFFIDVAGDNVNSYRGDYLASGGWTGLFTNTLAPGNSLVVAGDASQYLAPGQSVTLSFGGASSTHTITSVTYTPDAAQYNKGIGSTAVVITDNITIGASGTITLAPEDANSATQPPVADRVYLTGDGLMEIVKFYLDLRVRAAGIIVRIEKL